MRLSTVIEVLNDRFGTDFTDADQLFFDQLEADLVAEAGLAEQARANTIENFSYAFEDHFEGTLLDRMERNAAISGRVLDDPAFAEAVKGLLLDRVFARLRGPAHSGGG